METRLEGPPGGTERPLVWLVGQNLTLEVEKEDTGPVTPDSGPRLVCLQWSRVRGHTSDGDT